MPIPLERFVQQLQESGVVDSETLRDHLPPKTNPKNAEELARLLVRHKLLTKYQAEEISKGKGKSLVLGNYAILEKIGAGGMGQVFKARHRLMQRIVAVKMLPPENMRDPSAVARFEREVSTAAKLNHPNIVTAFDADRVAGVHLLVMEYVEGRDLAATVKKSGPLPIERALDYVLQAARGLQAAHAAGIVHRDIKPGNLLLDKQGIVRILDMGLAYLNSESGSAEELTQTGAVLGTTDYMSPEQALDTKLVDGRADIYSLGCTLYYLLAGRAAYSGDTRMKKLLAHRESPVPSLRDVRREAPRQLDACFRKMVAKTVEARYQSMTEVIAELVRLQKGLEPAISTPVTPSPTHSQVDDILHDIQIESTRIQIHSETSPGRARTWNLPLAAGGIVAAVILLAAIAIGFWPKSNTTVTTNKPGAEQRRDVAKATDQTAGLERERNPARKQELQFDRWLNDVAALSPEKQVAAVAEKLREYNAGFDGRVLHYEIVKDQVTSLKFMATDIEDISPLRALRHLRVLICEQIKVNTNNKGRLSDLSPLSSLPLEDLYCGFSSVSDLSPLAGKRLLYLNLGVTNVSDLSPLKGMPLRSLDFGATPVSDLTPLGGMRLEYLNCKATRVTDLSPLRGMPLKHLRCDFDLERDADILRTLTSLETINEKSVAQFWAEVESQ